MLRSMDGKVVIEDSILFSNDASIPLETHQLQPGMYLLQIIIPSMLYSSKVMVY
jgi:hypothetical protein